MNNDWESALASISPTIFKVTVHNGTGTGFILSQGGNLYGLATAYHVIANANELEMPIRITHYRSNTSIVLRSDPMVRVIVPYPEKDLAFIIFNKNTLDALQITPPNTVGPGIFKNAGVEIGWCGFPSVAPTESCFFHGFISSPFQHGYLVDGVVINGVSGGPAFYMEDGAPTICGVITQYLPNYATGQPLPGLGFVVGIEPYQQMLSQIRSLNQAQDVAEEQRESISTSPSPSPSPSPSEPEA